MKPQIPKIIAALPPHFQVDDPADRAVVDNACGCLARIVSSSLCAHFVCLFCSIGCCPCLDPGLPRSRAAA